MNTLDVLRFRCQFVDVVDETTCNVFTNHDQERENIGYWDDWDNMSNMIHYWWLSMPMYKIKTLNENGEYGHTYIIVASDRFEACKEVRNRIGSTDVIKSCITVNNWEGEW